MTLCTALSLSLFLTWYYKPGSGTIRPGRDANITINDEEVVHVSYGELLLRESEGLLGRKEDVWHTLGEFFSRPLFAEREKNDCGYVRPFDLPNLPIFSV